MASQTAIEYGSDRVRLIDVDGSARKLRVLKAVDVALPEAAEGDEDAAADMAAEAIRDAVRDARLACDPSGMAFDAGHALFREFDLPFTSDDQIEKVVRFEAESHIPLDIDDIVVQHVVLRKTRDKSHILATAIRKDELLDRFDILEDAALDPMFVDVDAFSLFNALVGTGLAGKHASFVVVNAQEHSTSLLFVVEGRLFAVRTLRLGWHGIPIGSDRRAVAAEPPGESGGGEPVAADAGGDAPGSESAILRLDQGITTARTHEFLGRLEREIRRTLTTLPSLGEVEVVYVTGSGHRVSGFRQQVGDAFGARAESLDWLEHVDHRLPPDEAERLGPDLGVALGVAYKLLGLDVTATDFRREECAYTRKFEQVKSPLIVLSFVAFLVVALMGIDAYYRMTKVTREYEYLLANAEEQLKLLLGDNAEAEAVYGHLPVGPRRVQAIRDRVQKEYDEKSSKLGRGGAIPVQESALHVWIEFANLVEEHEKELGRFWLTSLDIDVNARIPSLKFEGELESAAKYQRFLDILRADPLYADVEDTGTAPTENGIRFTETVCEIDLEELAARRNT